MTETEEPKLPVFRSAFLNDYLAMVEDSESPRLYHLWTAISAVSGALGRRCWLPFGVGDIYPNQFILLVGNPALKKSTACKNAFKLLGKATNVRFAPQDTAGQRQGLVEAMARGKEEEDNEADLKELKACAADNSMAALAGFTDSYHPPTNLEGFAEPERAEAELDKHHIYAWAPEFSRFIGQNNLAMLDFLTTMWDGEDYDYRTKQSRLTLENPLINLIAATTATSLNSALPPQAGGQGLLSRFILVYGGRKYKSVPRPKSPPLDKVKLVQDRLGMIYNEMHGAFTETAEAIEYANELYEYIPKIDDSRFVSYVDRRQIHQLKLSMAIAASRGTMEIAVDDHKEAHAILTATEVGMSEALGQFGLSPLAQVKQEMLEFLRAAKEPLPLKVIQGVFHKHCKRREIIEILGDLEAGKQVDTFESDTHPKEIYVVAIVRKNKLDDEVMNVMAQF